MKFKITEIHHEDAYHPYKDANFGSPSPVKVGDIVTDFEALPSSEFSGYLKGNANGGEYFFLAIKGEKIK